MEGPLTPLPASAGPTVLSLLRPLRLRLQHFGHLGLLPVLGFHVSGVYVCAHTLPHSRVQTSQDERLGGLLSCFLIPSSFVAGLGSVRQCRPSVEKAPPHLLCILSIAEARATSQYREGPGPEGSSRAHTQSLHVRYKKEPLPVSSRMGVAPRR